MTKMFHCITQGGQFNNNCNSKIKGVLPEIDSTKTVLWNFHVDELQVNYMYYMVLERVILHELNIDLCFSDNNIRANGGRYKVCTFPMKDISKINLKSLYSYLIKKIQNKELWEREHVMDTIWYTYCILYSHYIRLHHKSNI